MVIQHNMAATNSYRQLNTNNTSLNKNLEKLSSGFRINRAADDAAGLAISEAMRSKINGLDQAQANANDAIGLIQTEEGALTETHSMLQRMTTLATQAANGTYNTTSRDSIQKELDELGNEINRIANNTDYNDIKPLAQSREEGQVDSMTMQIGATKGETLKLKGQDMTVSGIFKDLDKIKVADDGTANAAKGQISTASALAKVKEMAGTSTTAQNNAVEKIQVKALESAGYVKVTANVSGMASAGTYVKAENLNADGSASTSTSVTPKTDGTAAAEFGSNTALKTAYNRQLDAYDGVRATDMSAKDKYDGAEYLQIGAETDADPTERANQVVSNIQKAINHVSDYRAELGAKQNRLEHTINNLAVTSENTTAAESRIRDTDMAKEIAAYQKNNILSQAAQSMLSQANQSGQGVLSLLR
ncbi:flagellin [[Clostridium] aminophilum]|uniref:Flagellin n=3 Tax=[Clostridium] aminophilum TaxID=1526 RepID=A0A1I0FUQ8_9FIRM|nr:flagellin [[Clostridium] aminophilum]SET61992.1 flagellin [[Clostridium] aminophilum]